MDMKSVENAVILARTFLGAAASLRGRVAMGEEEYCKTLLIGGCRETAAVRRASMDLTRALSDMRRRS